MALISNLLILAISVAFYLGQLLRFNYRGVSFPVIDILIVILAFTNLIYFYQQKKHKISNIPLAIFLTIAIITFIPGYFKYQNFYLKPTMYLVRLISIFSLFVFPINLKINNNFAKKAFFISLFTNIVFGIIQYFLWPDLTPFKSLNWDPHLNRLVSTFFDPTFTGIIYLIFLITVFFKKNFPFRIPILIITYFAITLTYSRSTFLSFIIAFLYISIVKRKPKIFLIAIIIMTITIICLPAPPGEGTKLERTSSIKAKIENYKEGISTFRRSPIIGHGYNYLSLARDPIPSELSHSSSGFDSSLMTILTTTGLTGLTFFLLGLKKHFNSNTLLSKTVLITVLVHSLFANSLLYPWVLICLYFII